jgi:hypothetical protein
VVTLVASGVRLVVLVAALVVLLFLEQVLQ